jgi:FMN reductase
MSTPFIVGLGGTLRTHSLSRAALIESLDIAATLGARSALLDLRELNLPMYSPDCAIEDYAPADRASIERLLDTCYEADAFVWASPTYHGTVSGVFKNALDFLEFLSTTNPPYLSGRPVGLVAINDGKTFTALTSSAQELRAWVAPTLVLLDKSHFDETLTVSSEEAVRKLRRQVQELIGFVR